MTLPLIEIGAMTMTTTTADARHLTPLQLGNEPVRNLINTARTRLAAAAAAEHPTARHAEALGAAQAAGKALVLVRRPADAEADTWEVLAAFPDNHLSGWARTFTVHTRMESVEGWVEGWVAHDMLSNADAFLHLVEHLLGQPFRSCAVCAPAGKVG